MTWRPSIPAFSAWVAVLGFAAGCGNAPLPSQDPGALDTSAGAIIGGAPGGPEQVGHTFRGNTRFSFCTATLVAPDLILTAKHCVYVNDDPMQGRYIDIDTVLFTLSSENDPNQWTDAVQATDLYLAPTLPDPTDGTRYYMFELTSDVAVYRLATPITKVQPLTLSRDLPGPNSPHFFTAGFGVTSHDGVNAMSRNFGPVTFAMNGGSALKRRFPTYADYEAAVLAIAPDASLILLQSDYDREVLAPDYEMLFDAPGDVQACNGDSGGPLLQKDAAGAWRVFGTTSGADGFTLTARCYYGSVFSTFGPETLHFLDSLGLLPPPDSGGGGDGDGSSKGGCSFHVPARAAAERGAGVGISLLVLAWAAVRRRAARATILSS